MKQLKFLMVAFTLLMGVSFTSCIGDSDPTVNSAAIGRVTNIIPYTFQMADGYSFVATNSIETTSNISVGDIVQFMFTYNSDEQQFTETNKSIKAQITPYQNMSRGTDYAVTDNNGAGAPYENATINELVSTSSDRMQYFDKNTLLIPISFLAKADLYKHSFTLVYDESAVDNQENDDVLTLYLRHTNSEEEPAELVGVYKAFNIAYLLSVYGKIPTKIKVFANETNKSNSNDLEDAKDELQFEEIEYKSVFYKEQ